MRVIVFGYSHTKTVINILVWFGTTISWVSTDGKVNLRHIYRWSFLFMNFFDKRKSFLYFFFTILLAITYCFLVNTVPVL